MTPTLSQKIKTFLETLGRKDETLRTYRFVLENKFLSLVGNNADLSPATYTKYIESIKYSKHTGKPLKKTTQNTYVVPVIALYAFWESPHLATLKNITKHMLNIKRKKTLVKFNREAIEEFIVWCEKLRGDIYALRDRAFVITLVDTGLRIHEACKMRRGQINWDEAYIFIEGKGEKESIIRFSDRSINAMKMYLAERDRMKRKMKNVATSPLVNEPVFASHGVNARNKITAVSKDGMRKAIKGTPDGKIVGRITEAGIDKTLIRIHDFRHYFVTRVYEELGIEAANDSGRHENFDTTKRYSHIADKKKKENYDKVFNKK